MSKEEEIKKELKEKGIDRRELARKMNITPAYLTQILNGWAPMKGEHEKAIKEELEKR
jgi:predicted transcriptional regulator